VRTRLELRRLTDEREHEALRCLALAAEYRDETSADHLAGVARLAGAIARELGMSERFAAILEAAAPLHDLGKVALPDAVLLKEGSLTDAEMEIVRGHCAIGAQILAGGTSPALALAREIAGGHHERWDGAGYPEGLVGEAIPLSARIVAVADVYDTLTRDRPYRRAWAEPAARGAIVASAGREFDPDVVAAFERTLG